MAIDKKISELTPGGPAQGGDLLPIDRTGANFSLTAQQIADLAPATPPGGGTGDIQVNAGGGNFGGVSQITEAQVSGLVSDLAALVAEDATLAGDITAEATARANADTTLQSNITAEASTRASADTTLQSNITSEASTRASADTTLQSNINAEASTRASADTTLQNNINTVSGDLTTEASTRASADTTLQNNINSEASTRAAADSSLSSDISTEASTRASADSTLQSNITAEASTRASADTTLQTNINSEASTRASADTTLQTNITSEASTRASADTTLQNNINLKADINSPTLTGTPQTPNQPALSDNQLIANTKYVDDAAAAIVTAGAASPGATVSTPNDSYTAGETKNYTVVMAKSVLIWRITEATGKKFRLRLYNTSAARTADASRPYSVPLQLGSQTGCILDLYIEQSAAVTPWLMTPPIVGSNNDGPPQTTGIYAAITSVETGTANISITLSFCGLES